MHDGRVKIMAEAQLHRLPVIMRQGSRLELGDLNAEYEAALQAAVR